MVLGLRPAHHELAAHEELVVEDLDRAPCFIDIEHVDKAVALGLVGAAVVDDLDIADRADALEEILEVFFGGFVGQVAEVDAGAGGFRAVGALGTFAAVAAVGAFASFGSLPRWTGCRVSAALAGIAGVRLHFPRRTFFEADALLLLGAGRADRLFVESDGLEQFLPPGQWHGLVFAAWGTGAPVGSARFTAVAALAVALVLGAVRVASLVVSLPAAVPAFASAGALPAAFAAGASGIWCGVGHVLRFGWRVLVGDGGQPPAIGRGCGLDLPVRVAGFLVPGKSRRSERDGRSFHGPGTWRLSRAGPGVAGISANPRPPESDCDPPKRSAAAKICVWPAAGSRMEPELPDAATLRIWKSKARRDSGRFPAVAAGIWG